MDDNDDHQHDADDDIKKGALGRGAGRRASSPDPEPFRRIEVLTGSARRKTWPKDFKAHVIAETFAPGANVAAIARHHGVSIGLVHYWRKCARDGGLADPGPVLPGFIPVVSADVHRSTVTRMGGDGAIVLEVGGVVVRLEGAVNEVNLNRVLSVLRRRP